MSEKTKLQQLIQQYCPDGVEYITLNKLCYRIVDGMHNLPKDTSSEGKYPILSAQNIIDNKINLDTNKYVETEVFKVENIRTNVSNGDVLLTIVGAIGRTAIVNYDLKALFQRSICVLKPDRQKILSGYLKYVLDSSAIQSYMQTNAHGAAQKGLYLKQVEKISIPVPPLEVQAEIVRILDKFTEVTKELQTKLEEELTARQKQYEYYRDLLLNFGCSQFVNVERERERERERGEFISQILTLIISLKNQQYIGLNFKKLLIFVQVAVIQMKQ